MPENNKDKKRVGFKEFDPSKYVNTEPTLDEAIKGKSIVIAFGRMNPITVGHEKLASKVMAVAAREKAEPAIYLSHSNDPKKNPLSYEDKVKFGRMAFGNIVKPSKSRTIIDVAKELSGKYGKLIVIAGSDRVKEFSALLQKYNGRDYTFDKIDIVSAGERDPDAEGVEGMSASKMREIAKEGNLEEFKKGLPRKLQSKAKQVMDAVRKGMKLAEELEEINEALTRAQRRKLSISMRRNRAKMKLGREKAKRRRKDSDKLEKVARRRAIKLFQKKFAKHKRYADMEPSEKERIEKKIAKIPKERIERIAKKMLIQVKADERSKFSKMATDNPTTPQKESFEQIDELDSKTYRSYHDKATADQIKRMSKDKRSKEDQRIMKKRSLGIATAGMKQYGDKRSLSQRIRGEEVEQIDEKVSLGGAFRGLTKAGKAVGGVSNAIAAAGIGAYYGSKIAGGAARLAGKGVGAAAGTAHNMVDKKKEKRESFASFMESNYEKAGLKRPHMMMDSNKKPKIDGRFKAFKKKDHMVESVGDELYDLMEATEAFAEAKDDPCWKDYEMVGMKKKGKKMVPNCVPKEEVELDEAKSDKIGEFNDESKAKAFAKKHGGYVKSVKFNSRGNTKHYVFKESAERVESLNDAASKFLEEKLKASDDMGKWVKDFQDSDAPQFKGKSQKERQKMAIAAKLSAERNESVEEFAENWATKAMSKNFKAGKYKAPSKDDKDRDQYKNMMKKQYGSMMGGLKKEEGSEYETARRKAIKKAVNTKPEVEEAAGAGKEGTNQLVNKYKKDTPNA